MADYYALIAKSITSRQSPEARRAVYERGRNALRAELDAVTPSLRQSIIAKELLAFEDAVSKVEAEVVRRTRGQE
ncbi:MAG: hypothetical protein WB822_14405 [Rhodoplanes sp.]